MARAIAGGQTGCNGEFYRGGEFLPSTDAAKGTWRREQARQQKILARKVQTSPGVWEVRPSLDVVAIYSMWGNAVIPEFRTKSGKPEAHPIYCGEYNRIDPKKVQQQIDRYLAGEKWMPMNAIAAQ